MNQTTYNTLKAFIWGIANECLVDVYDVGDYRKVILPMLVIRRFDAVLEPVHDNVMKMKKEMLERSKSVNIDPALCHAAGQEFANRSEFTLKKLKTSTKQQQLRMDFINYLDGFTQNIQEIIDKFHFRDQIPRLSEHDRLGLLIEKFIDPRINLSNKPVLNDDGTEKLEALDNHTMGTLFEEIIRMFNEQTNVTDAGRHFTPRDIIELMADLAFIPIKDKIQSTAYQIYDGACGTGGMLTVGESCIKELAQKQGKTVSIHLFGQENFDETYAIACADMLLKGENTTVNKIVFASTISQDGFRKKEFDFMLSNPPFGTSWKSELKAWGDIKKEDIDDPRFLVEYDGNPEYSLIPDIGDPQMLFLANNISKMKRKTALGSRIVEVHNGSSLFTGDAGNGSSNLRRYIIESDMLEAIVALPEKMFYNTGIGTYLWIVTNQKDERRKGKVQLIDATSLKSPLRKNIGEKNSEITEEIRKQIINYYLDFESADMEYSKVFQNEEFGYYSVTIERPLRLRVNLDDNTIEKLKASVQDEIFIKHIENYREKFGNAPILDYNLFFKRLSDFFSEARDNFTKKRKKYIRDYLTTVDENAIPTLDENGLPEADKNLRDNEQIPLLYKGGTRAFFENEIKPYVPDAWIDEKSITIGYELSFTKYFYKPQKLRAVNEIIADLKTLENEAGGMMDEILRGID